METQLLNFWHSFPPNSTEAWLNQINKELKGDHWEQALTHDTPDGIRIKPVYTRSDAPKIGKARNYAGWMLRKDFDYIDLHSALLRIDQLKAKGVNYLGIRLKKSIEIKDIDVLLASAALPVILNFQERLSSDFFKQLATLKNSHGITLISQDSSKEMIAFADKVLNENSLWYPYYLKTEANSAVDQLTNICLSGAQIFQDCDNVDYTAAKMVLELPLGDDFFIEIAKLRSMRILWANVVKAFQGKEESRHTFIHAQCSGTTALESEPYRLLISNSNQALAAVLGGADTIHLGSPEIAGQEDMLENVAAGVSHLLMHESLLDKTADPAHGSYYIEYLTHEMVLRSWNNIYHQLNAQV